MNQQNMNQQNINQQNVNQQNMENRHGPLAAGRAGWVRPEETTA